MRKIFKLRGEIILRVVVTLILTFIITHVIWYNYESYTKYEKLKERSRDINKSLVEEIISTLKPYETNDVDLINEIQNNDKVFARVYLVNSHGNVLAESKKEGIKVIDIWKVHNTIKQLGIRFESKNIFKIRDNRYLIIFIDKATRDDSKTMLLSLIISVIICIFLLKGRVKYIVKIGEKVKSIAKGDLSMRVPLKYKNELRDLAANINYMVQELEREDIKKNEFITNIAHDLRTPLTTILGYTKMIQEKKYKDYNELNSYVDTINRKGLYLKTLLDDFFSYSKLSSKAEEFEEEEIYIQELLRQLVEDEEINFKDKEIEVVSNFNEKPLYTFGNAEMLARAIGNLLVNAQKYSKEKSEVIITVQKEVINKIDYGVITVFNIPKEEVLEEDIKRFFERLYKGDTSRNNGGSGLGLTITEEIIKLHKGVIQATKSEGGIIFIVGLKLLL
ncbi:HAMP domain-containing sensor histidine kinase [Oceanirhabdus sp. W0125-5]|uniref:HAMP domain-containing sensor histidine kinase n=1 Tax=Oceanirhabdus sp. W0125-5 TaxID=2999116 RepID=UPI0022F2C441|nr:HAMP domain-containing sensor histidine kinase [Oceanirhabdus sp. W0125-5]WBW99042.1 HAMP domain-containing sensor histidine kinase [Oceanirhabdus sp. W0125-5]